MERHEIKIPEEKIENIFSSLLFGQTATGSTKIVGLSSLTLLLFFL